MSQEQEKSKLWHLLIRRTSIKKVEIRCFSRAHRLNSSPPYFTCLLFTREYLTFDDLLENLRIGRLGPMF